MISFVIPVRNEEKNIASCIDSIIESCIGYEYEIIVVDNGSTDRTKDILENYNCLVIDMPDVTVSQLRNTGSLRAKYEFLGFVDADVLISKQWCEVACGYLGRNDDVVCLGGYVDIPCDATWVEKTWHLKQEFRPAIKAVEWVSSMNMVVRKDSFIAIGGFDQDLITCEDVNLCKRLAVKGKIIYVERLKCVHKGEAKTLKQFFYKERWRGVGNVKAFVSSPRISDIPGTLMPFFYLGSYPLVLYSSFFRHWLLVPLLASLLIYPVLKSCVLVRKTRKYGFIIKLIVIWSLYCFSRSVSVFAPRQRKESAR